MSRREGRDSDSRHHRSRFDREPSPKRVRRDGRTATEETASTNHKLDSTEHVNRDKKHAVVPDSKIQTVSLNDKKSNGYREGTKNSSENIEPPRSRSHVQHDERAGQVGRNYRNRDTSERGRWKDLKDRESGRATNRSSSNGSYKVEPDIKKKRPSFRETKVPLDAVTHDKPATEVSKEIEGNGRKEDGGKPLEKPVGDRHDRRLSGERDPQRMKFQSRDRFGGGGGGSSGGGGYRGRGDRFSGRQGQGGGGVDKWKHDLYDEANKSPTSKNEEDQIAKVEALLAS